MSRRTQVKNVPTSVYTSRPEMLLQRKCACGQHTIGGSNCAACAKKEETLQRSAAHENETAHEKPAVPESVHQVLGSAGQPLDATTRTFMESRFGHDFSQVRLHTDSEAAASARAVNALAYTVGRDVVFGAGQFAPATMAGRQLLAHELTHTIQQEGSSHQTLSRLEVGEAGDAAEREADQASRAVMQMQTFSPSFVGPQRISRQPPPPPAAPPAAPAPPQPAPPPAAPAQPAFGQACSGGANDPCQMARCVGQRPANVQADLGRGLGYVNSAITALSQAPLADNTVRALDWFFNDHSSQTVLAVRTRLGCIATCLTDTQTNSRFGCDPPDDSYAYVCVGTTPVCSHVLTNLCLTDAHFRTSDRVRGETVVHECAHRVGMSLGGQSVPDIYEGTPRFSYLSTAETLLNADSFALFAAAVSQGIRLSVRSLFGLTGGVAAPIGGRATWYARLYTGVEFQHPVMSIFNPTIGIGVSFIGETTTTEGATSVTSHSTMLTSLVGGVRIGPSRPGSAGGGYVSLFGGPALAFDPGSPTRLGAEAGFGVGYRWRWLDASAGIGYTYDPTRRTGSEHLITPSATLTFVPFGRD